MSTELEFPDMKSVTFGDSESAKNMADILNQMFGQLMWLEQKYYTSQQEMEGMWEHIRNLERKLLNPTEYEIYY